MLKATEAFRNKVLNSPSFLEWRYVVKNGGREYDGEIIKNLSISGQLQNQFTIGSSLSKSLELELLVSEETEVDPIIMVEASVVIGRTQAETPEGTVIDTEYSDSVVVGYFHVTEVDRGTYGKLKIYAIDMMGHPDYLSNSVVDFSIFNDVETDVGIIVDAIAGVCGLSTNIADEYREIRISNFFTALTALTYKQTIEDTETDRPSITHRQLLEYVAGFCGCNVRINSYKDEDENIINEIEFFKFTHTKDDLGNNIVLTADNYYSMTKGIHEFKPTGIVCTGLNNKSILVGGTGKDSETIKMTNPFIDTKDLLLPISRDYCEDGYSENRVSYYPITAELVGTCLFEPGDIITIEEVFRDSQTGEPIKKELRKVYIQDYKLSFNNGIKETIQSFFDYSKGSIANSISGKISQLNTDLENTKTYINDHYVSNKDFKITIEDISTNIQYANDGLNKWIVEYYELTSPVEGKVYDMDSVMGLEYKRRELIEDDERLVAKNIYEGITVCRFKTGIYVVPEGGALFRDVDMVTTVGAYVYINGGGPGAEIRTNEEMAEFGKAYGDLSESYPIRFRSGWNVVEIYVGYERDKEAGTNDTAIDTLFWLNYPDNDSLYPFYNISATYTQEEKDNEDKKTVAISYVDHEGFTIGETYKEKHKKGEEYDVTDKVTEYIEYDGTKYFYLEVEGDLKGTLDKTTIIKAKYISEEYMYDNAYYLNKEDNTEIKSPISSYLIKSSPYYEIDLKEDIIRCELKKVVLEYRIYNESKNKIETITETRLFDIPADEYIFSLENRFLLGCTRKYYYEQLENIRFTVNFVEYRTGNKINTFEIFTGYQNAAHTVEAPAGYRCIGFISDELAIESYLDRTSTSIKLTPIDENVSFTVFIISSSEVYITASSTDNRTGEKNFLMTVEDIGKKLVYSTNGFTVLLPDDDEESITEHDFILFDPKLYEDINYVIELKRLEHGASVIELNDTNASLILQNDVYINLIFNTGYVSYASFEDESSSLPAFDDSIETETEEKIYKRFSYITLINPYVIDINYKYVKEVERLTTADSIIDRITEKKYEDDDGNEYNGAEYLIKHSSVVQTIDEIEQRIEVEEKTSEEVKYQMSEVSQSVDGFKLTFDTALYGNYLSNSAFNTDDPLAGFSYQKPENSFVQDIFTYSKALGALENIITVDRYDTSNYGYIIGKRFDYAIPSDGYGFLGVVPNDSENAYTSGNRTLSMNKFFKIGQTFYREKENFPFYKDNDTGEYFQFYISIRARRTKNCIMYQEGLYPYLSLNISFNYEYIEVIDELEYTKIGTYKINNLRGQPSKDEGKTYYGTEVDLDNLKKLEDYEIDTDWKQIDYFFNLPKDLFDSMSNLISITVSYETKYIPSVSKSFIYENDYRKDYYNLETPDIDEEEGVVPSIFICEPMFGTTKNYSRLPFTTKKAELITGITNITQDGIQISRSNSSLTTAIGNNGMVISYDKEPVAIFKQTSIIPELEVTKKLTAPNIFINDYERTLSYTVNKNEDDTYTEETIVGKEIPEEIVVDWYYNGSDLGYWGGYSERTKIAPVFKYFNEVQQALKHYGIIQLDKLTIRVKKVDSGVFPWALGGAGASFRLENLRCGIIDIILEEDVVLATPIVLKNIEGTVRIRGPKDKNEIVLDDYYINGNEGVGKAPVVDIIIAHNVKWLEVFGINFSGGNFFIDYNEPFSSDSGFEYNPDRGGYCNESIYPDMVFKTDGEFATYQFNDTSFDFINLYDNGTLQELNEILNKTAIFIGYCNLVDISYCNFPVVYKETNTFSGKSMYNIGVIGDHSDCYLKNNKGIFGIEYYKNRSKCWFRIPPEEEIKEPVPTVQPLPVDIEGYKSFDITDGIFPGGMISKIEQNGTALEHCFVGKNKDLAYLGAFQYNGGTDINEYIPYIIGSNTTNYSRIRRDADLKRLWTLYENTNGYFFGGSSTLPAITYNPNDTTEESYTGYKELKYTSLYNGMGISIEIPDLSSELKNSILTDASLVITFETASGELVEYGSTTSLSEENAAVYFGVRLVYDKDAHYKDHKLRKGYYNMGKCTRAHEFISDSVNCNLNTWAINDEGNSIHNFDKFGDIPYGAELYIGGRIKESYGEPVIEESGNEVTINLTNVVRPGKFSDEFITEYTEKFVNTSAGYVSPENFFNSLNGLSSGSISYIDIAPVGVNYLNVSDNPSDWYKPIEEDHTFPYYKFREYYRHDCTEDNDSAIALSTSCFKIKKVKLNITYEKISLIKPTFYALTIKYVDENGNIIRSNERITAQNGSTLYIDKYKYGKIEGDACTYNYSHCAEGNISSVYLDKDKEITFVYLTKEIEYRIAVYFTTLEDKELSPSKLGFYDTYVKRGEQYNVLDIAYNPEKYGINIDTYNYQYNGMGGDSLQGYAYSNKNIYIYYEKIVNGIDLVIEFIDKDFHSFSALRYQEYCTKVEQYRLKEPIRARLMKGRKYNIVNYIDDNLRLNIYDDIAEDYIEWEFCDYRSGTFGNGYEFSVDSQFNSQGLSNTLNFMPGVFVLFVMYKKVVENEGDKLLPACTYLGPNSSTNYETKFVDWNSAFVGIFSRYSNITDENIYYYRHNLQTIEYWDTEEEIWRDRLLPYYPTNGVLCGGRYNKKLSGNLASGFQYLFNTREMISNFKNSNDIYLNIKFSKKSYAPIPLNGGGDGSPMPGASIALDGDIRQDNLYYFICLLIGKTGTRQGYLSDTDGHHVVDDGCSEYCASGVDVNYYGANSFIELDNKDGKPSVISLNYGSIDTNDSGTGYYPSSSALDIERYELLNNDIIPFSITGCSYNSTSTYTQKIKLNDITFPKEWYDEIVKQYQEDIGCHINPDVFTNVDELARKGMIAGIIVYPTDPGIAYYTTNNWNGKGWGYVGSYGGDDTRRGGKLGDYNIPYSLQALKILDIWLSKE